MTDTILLDSDGRVALVWRGHARDAVAGTFEGQGTLVEVASDPPVFAGMVRLVDGSFALPPPPPPTAAELVAHAAARRWAVQTGGITLASGVRVATDDDTRSALSQAIQSIDLGIVSPPVQWKLPGGFASLSRADLIAIAQAVAAHVQAAFDTEAALASGIAAGTVTTLDAVDAAAWPSNA